MESQATKQHIYVANIGGGEAYRNKRAVATLVFEMDENCGERGFRLGWSLCQPDDFYVQRKGIALAKRRLAYLKQEYAPLFSENMFNVKAGDFSFEEWFNHVTTNKEIQPATLDALFLDTACTISPAFQRVYAKVCQHLENIAFQVDLKKANKAMAVNREAMIKKGIVPFFADTGLPDLCQASLNAAFEEVSHTNLAFLNPKGVLPEGATRPYDRAYTKHIFDQRSVLKKQLEMVREEIAKELIEADTPKKVRDALCDAGVFTLGAFHYIGHAPRNSEIVSACYADPNSREEVSAEIVKELNKTLEYLDDLSILNPDTSNADFRVSRFSDSLYQLLGTIIAAHSGTGYNFWLDMRAVYRSNMSKLVNTESEAFEAQASYALTGVEVEVQYNEDLKMYFVRSSRDQVVGDKEYPKGKFLKCLGFHEPRFVD